MKNSTIPVTPPFSDEHAQPFFAATAVQRKELEAFMAQTTGSDAALAVNTAEAAFRLLFDWLGVGKGDEVILSVYNPFWLGNAIIRYGAKPVLVDTLSTSPHIDPEGVRRAISERTKMVIGSAVMGIPCDLEALQQVVNNARVHGVYIPRTIPQQRLGRIMVVGFYPEWPQPASVSATGYDFLVARLAPYGIFDAADGAALSINMPGEFNAKQLYSQLANQANGGGETVEGLPDNMSEPGMEALMSPAQVLANTGRLTGNKDNIAQRKTEVLEKYRFVFGKIRQVSIDSDSNLHFSGFAFSIPGIDPEELVALVRKVSGRGVPLRFLYQPLHRLTWYAGNTPGPMDFPNADKHFYRTLILPLHEEITPATIVEYADVLSEELGG